MELDFSQGNTKYLIDTSGLINLEYIFKYDNPVFTAIWEEIEELIQQDSFKTIDFVEDEINNYEGKEDFFIRSGCSSQPLSREEQSAYEKEHWRV